MPLKDRIAMWFAWHFLPKRIVYWCAVRVGAEASEIYSKTDVPSITIVDALRAWKK